MAKVLISGNELLDPLQEGWTVFSGNFSTTVSQPIGASAGSGKTLQGNGSKAYFYLCANIGLNMLAKTLNIPLCTGPAAGGTNEVFVRFRYHNNARTENRRVFTFYNSNTGLQVAALYHNSGNFELRNGANANISTGFAFPTNAWTRIELHVKSGASGAIFELWVDDVLRVSATGQNLSNGTTVVFDQIAIGNTERTDLLQYFDDVVVNDTTGTVNNGRCGEGSVIAIFPTRAGTFSQLKNAYNTNAENYDHVNRTIQSFNDPFNNSLYVGTNTPGDKDSYKGASLPLEVGGIGGVVVCANAVRNGASIQNAKLLITPGVRAPNAVITPGAATSGGSGTNGTHRVVVVNKIGTAYSLPSALSTQITFAGGNNQAPLTVPVSSSPLVDTREIYASKANQDTTIDVSSNGVTLPAGTINVADTSAFAASGTIFVTTSNGLQLVSYTGKTGTSFTGCTGGSGLMSTGGLVVGGLFLVGNIPNNTGTSFTLGSATPVTNGADASFSTLQAPSEITGANVALPNGAFGGVSTLFEKNPTTGLAWTKDEIEEIEFGLQFVT